RQLGGFFAEYLGLDGVDERLYASRRALHSSNNIEVAVLNREVLAANAERSRYRPAHSVKHHFSADDAVEKCRRDGIALDLIGKAGLAEAIAQQTAEQRL